MPESVWKKIVALQRNFLRSGAREGNKIAWVKWSDVCRPKECGGLGIKNLRLVNIALLTKWRWRLHTSKDVIWKSVLMAKYGKDIVASSDLAVWRNVKFASLWWKDICRLGVLNLDPGVDWCRDIMVKKLGNGGTTKFWLHCWKGARLLSEEFPRLFSVSTQQHEVISDMGHWSSNDWIWNLNWRRNLFQWELDLVAQLERYIRDSPILLVDDSWL
ncbi:DUF4283 domain protein [Trifolium medium]|uniref:DUF4283 domain protein n=1 Tax=Trifolium medium TaxID=97028 RepID=A0A392NXZ1_9FABA|nr:DUF4283 domain protein [Trifolium medium]